MKVLLFARDFAPEIGGVQNLLARLTDVFDPEQILVLTRKTEGWRAHDAGVAYKVVRMPSLARWPWLVALPLRALLSLFYVLRGVIGFSPDLMICAYAKGNAPYGWLARRLFKLPYVVFAYGTDVIRYAGKGRLIRKWLADADLVAAISEPVRKFVYELTDGAANVIVVPLGKGFSGPAVAEPFEGYNGVDLSARTVMLSVCRLTPRKGVDRTINAVAKLIDRHPDLLYVVVGDGPDRSRLNKLVARRGLEKTVLFAGRVSDQDLLRFYATARLLVLASRERDRDIEGFGLVFVEAGAFGLPVIGGDSGGIREAVEHQGNGLLVDPQSADAISQAIDRLLADRDLAARLGREGKRRAQEIFTWENCKQAILDALDKS